MKIYNYAEGPAVFIADEKVTLTETQRTLVEEGVVEYIANRMSADRVSAPSAGNLKAALELCRNAEQVDIEKQISGKDVKFSGWKVDGTVYAGEVTMNGQTKKFSHGQTEQVYNQFK